LSQSIPASFAAQFAREIQQAFQKRTSHLRQFVRVQNVVNAASVTFQNLGMSGPMVQKARHGEIPAQDILHTPLAITPADFYLREQYDNLDLLKIQHDERGALADAQGFAAARHVDLLLVTALNLATNTVGVATAMTFNLALQAVTLLRNNDVDQPLVAAVSPHAWSQLLGIASFANADWVGPGGIQIPDGHMTGKRWVGADWFNMTGLPTTGAVPPVTSNFMWTKNAVGLAVNADPTTTFWYNGEKDTWSIVTKLSMGARILDPRGVVRILHDASSALPA
jgi:deoxyinosine 3'endonuclease (endonuclease V)